MDSILKEYLLNTLPAIDHWEKRIEKQAEEEKIPIMDQLSIHFLLQMIRIIQPQKILEIGTGIGYSALRMHSACPSSYIITIERDPIRYEQAVQHIQEQNKQSNIQVIYGDAIHELNTIDRSKHAFEFVFIDAAKSKYKQFFQLSSPLLTKGGIILTDNVLFRGYVAKAQNQHTKYKKLVRKIHEYNEWLVNHPDYITTFIPIGDGIAISYKKGDDK